MTSAERTLSRVGVAALRQAIANRVEATSLRSVAREVGMSAPGLQSFLNGGSPYESTRRKLTMWYFAHRFGQSDELTRAMAENLLGVLLSHIPEEHRPRARADVVSALVRATKREKLTL